jgi:hypothetical protein
LLFRQIKTPSQLACLPKPIWPSSSQEEQMNRREANRARQEQKHDQTDTGVQASVLSQTK